jgi:hypothetical protein
VLVTPLECRIVLLPILHIYIYLFIYLFVYLFIYVCVYVCGQHGVVSLKTLSLVEIPSPFLCYFDGILLLYITNFKTWFRIYYDVQFQYACDAKTCPLKSNANCRKIKSQ